MSASLTEARLVKYLTAVLDQSGKIPIVPLITLIAQYAMPFVGTEVSSRCERLR